MRVMLLAMSDQHATPGGERPFKPADPARFFDNLGDERQAQRFADLLLAAGRAPPPVRGRLLAAGRGLGLIQGGRP
jgi:hypothetical protein